MHYDIGSQRRCFLRRGIASISKEWKIITNKCRSSVITRAKFHPALTALVARAFSSSPLSA